MSNGTNFIWDVEYTFLVGDSSANPEVTAFLNPKTDINLVVIGVGAKITNNDFTMIQLVVAPIQSDGTLGPSQTRKFGNTKDSPDLTVSAPAQEVLVGLGMRAANGKLATLYIYARALNPETGLLGSDVFTHSAGDTNHEAQTEFTITEARFGLDGLGGTIITGVGARCDGSSNVTTLTFQIAQMETIVTDVQQQERAHVKATRGPQTYISSNLPEYLKAAVYADDAYCSTKPDSFFQGGYTRVDGHFAKYSSVDDWTTQNHYSKFQDGNNGYWGIIHVDGSVLYVAFRGTRLFSYSDLAVDLKGFDPTPSEMAHGQTVFVLEQWSVAGQTPWVHKGFYDTYKSLKGDLRNQIGQQFAKNSSLKSLTLVGHSLGGALAQVCAVDLYGNPIDKVPKPKVITFGAPLVGDATFASLYSDSHTYSHLMVQPNDLVPMVPNSGRVSNNQVVPMQMGAGKEILPNPKWSPMAHFLEHYYYFMRQLSPSTVNTDLSPSTPITDLKLRIQTQFAFGAGTDSDIHCEILGVEWGPLQGSFEYGSSDTVDLYYLWPSRKPQDKDVSDLYGSPVFFWLGSIGFTNTYSYTWALDYVDVIVNGVTLCRLQYQKRVGPGDNDVVVAVIGK